MHELCYEKNSELDEDNPRCKFKGRDVFLGDQVKDQDGNVALFRDLSSVPATMAASKFADFHGCLPGHDIQTADVTSAYLQAFLKSPSPTWVELPKHRWPSHWHGKYYRPVVPLLMALYGHPEAGGYWEQHCEEQVLEAGFSLACEEWPGCYWHEELKCFLVVYVDDMKMSGPKANLAEAWTRLRKNLKMDDPEPSGRYLGCEHEIKKVSVDGKSYTTMTYNMEEFLDSCLAKYTEVAGGNVKFKHVPTPFLDDFVKKGPCAPSGDGIWHERPWCCGRFSAEEFKVGQGKSCKDQSAERPATPEVTDRGELANDASSVLMKVLYGARMARFDLLRAV